MKMSRSIKTLRSARRGFASAVALPQTPPAPIWDTFVYHPVGPVDFFQESTASPIATSSKITLDHFPPKLSTRLPPYPPPKSSDWSGAGEALSFATDEELIHTLLLPRVVDAGSEDWRRTLDPSMAFLALRSRESYPSFLRSIRTYISSLYPLLRSARVHQLFVSDLLLRNPDPLVLRDLLNLDAEAPPAEPLRNSLLVSMYSNVRSARRLALTPQAALSVCRAMVQAQDWDGLEDAWNVLFDTSDYEPESNYHLLDLLIQLEPHRSDQAMVLFSKMIPKKNGQSRLPMGSLAGIDKAHPRASELLLRSAMVRACLTWKLCTRARSVMDELLDMVSVTELGDSDGQAIGEAMGLARRVCRDALASGESSGLDWVQGMFQRWGDMREAELTKGKVARIPGRLIDLYIDARYPFLDDAKRSDLSLFNVSIKATDRTLLSPVSLLRIAQSDNDRKSLLAVAKELFTHAREAIDGVMAPFIRAVLSPAGQTVANDRAGTILGISANAFPLVVRPSFALCQHAVAIYLSSSSTLSPSDQSYVIKRLGSQRPLAKLLLQEQERRLMEKGPRAQSGRMSRSARTIGTADRLALMECCILIKDMPNAHRLLAELQVDDALSGLLVDVILRSPEVKRQLELALSSRGLDHLVPEF